MDQFPYVPRSLQRGDSPQFLDNFLQAGSEPSLVGASLDLLLPSD